jgi:hypothetical protein
LFIQNDDARPLSNTNSIPVCGGKLSRSDNPWVRSGGVSAISASNTTSPILTAGVEGTDVAEGVALGTGELVEVGEGGITVTVGAAVITISVGL